MSDQRYLLERLVDGDKPRRMTPDEQRAALARIFEQVPEAPAPLDENRAHHVLAAWRLLREMARTVGLVQDDETLEAALDGWHPDPWVHPIKPVLTPHAAEGPRVTSRKAGAVVAAIWAKGAGLPLLPPEDPEQLERWCEAARIVAQALGMHRQEGGWAVAPLTRPETVHMLGLTQEDLMDFEREIIAEVQTVSMDQGGLTSAIAEHFRDMYGLSSKEAVHLIQLENALAAKVEANTERDRAWAVNYLRDYIRRSRSTMNMADEMRAIKELSRVQGLTRTLPENIAGDFLDVIRTVSQAQDAAQLEEPRIFDALPAHEEDDAFDREAEREFEERIQHRTEA